MLPSPGWGQEALLLQHRFHKMVKVSNVQVYIIVIITGVDSLQRFGVGWLVGFFFFLVCFCTKESNIFLPNIYIFNEEKRYINVCTFQFF